MLKYKRYIKLFFAFLGLFLLIFVCLHFLSKGYTNSYKINDKVSVKQIYTKDEKDEHDNYYLEIKYDNTIFNYQFYLPVKDDSKLVKDVLVYDGKYKCVLPIFNNDIKVDFSCYKDNVYYNYHDLVGEEEKLDDYISKVDKNQYNVEFFDNNLKDQIETNKITYYKKEIPEDIIVSLTTLKGVATIDDKIEFIELFDKDIYKRELSIFTSNYYVTADYSENQEFRSFYVVNLLDGKKQILKAPDYISFDSYIEGVVDDNVYVYDINNEKQYKIDIKKSLITEVGNPSSGIKYYDGKWSFISIVKAKNKTYFKTTSEDLDQYEYLYKIANKKSGFYYYFEKDADKYKVYRSNVQNNKLRKYLFSVDDYRDVVFEEDYAFYKDNDTIKLYSDYTGIKTIIMTKELDFNDNIIFNAYKK